MYSSSSDHGRSGSRADCAKRSPSGQAAIALNLVIGAFIIGMLFTFVYELTRFLLAREQLKTIVQSSALAGEATILSSTQASAAARNTAQQTALNIFRRNAILGTLLRSASIATSPAFLNPEAGQTQLAIEWIDPITRTASPDGSVLRLTAAYNYALFSANFMGSKAVAYTMSVSEIAALPKVDLVILMDESGSMDDQTYVSTVKRSWDYDLPDQGGITYTNPGGGGGGGGGTTIGSFMCANPMGTGLNALPPQNLEVVNVNSTTCKKYWSEIGYPNNPNYATRGMRGVGNTGCPPGNGPPPPPPPPPGAPPNPPPSLGPALGPFGLYNGANPNTAGPQRYSDNTNLEFMTFNNEPGLSATKVPWINLDLVSIFSHKMPWEQEAAAQNSNSGPGSVNYPADLFTDLVCNIDGKPTFQGYTSPDGFVFPNLASLVEASRGNLEGAGVYGLSGANILKGGGGVNVVPQPGYQAAYNIAAAQQILPQAVVHSSANTFMTKVINSTDAHFGFVAFSDRAGTSPTDALQNYNVSWDYDVAGASNFPLPNIGLNPNSNNFTTVQNWIKPSTAVTNFSSLISVNGGTNTADALKQGLDQLTDPTKTRRGSLKAIVLVTDGVPSRDVSGTIAYMEGANAQAQADAVVQANRASTAGIPIYIVAVAQDPTTLGAALDQAYLETASGSILNAAGHGSKYYRVNWSDRATTQTTSDATFGNIARQLTSLIR
jgi:hypothetical protein